MLTSYRRTVLSITEQLYVDAPLILHTYKVLTLCRLSPMMKTMTLDPTLFKRTAENESGNKSLLGHVRYSYPLCPCCRSDG